ncbi:AIG2-like family [Nesidiocoris tenuis]|uniref:Gamma-glutamylcyclotransferase family protein n=1 Tax=Nesidiocoris tenuis TaxID=355587 RepID=A0ABN7AZK1_9HEMI|nr:AIG2-like family [Nesidiocoris tenuis]
MEKAVDSSTVESAIKVFVYGTLKKGEPNHNWLENKSNGTAKFEGQGQTKLKYPLVVATKFNIPFLLDAGGEGNNVQGEVYEVDEKMLSNLDILEEHPRLYVRRLEDILLNGVTLKCWAYFLPKFKPELLKLKMLTSYTNNGPDSLPYCESDDDEDLSEELFG